MDARRSVSASPPKKIQWKQIGLLASLCTILCKILTVRVDMMSELVWHRAVHLLAYGYELEDDGEKTS